MWMLCPTIAMSITPPWLFPTPSVELQLKKVIMDKQGCVSKQLEMTRYFEQKYNRCLQIYTDGSKDPDSGRTASAVVIHLEFKYEIYKRITNPLSVYTAETIAVLMEVQWVEDSCPSNVEVFNGREIGIKTRYAVRNVYKHYTE